MAEQQRRTGIAVGLGMLAIGGIALVARAKAKVASIEIDVNPMGHALPNVVEGERYKVAFHVTNLSDKAQEVYLYYAISVKWEEQLREYGPSLMILEPGYSNGMWYSLTVPDGTAGKTLAIRAFLEDAAETIIDKARKEITITEGGR